MQNRTRSKQLNIKLTEDEYEFIKNRFNVSGKYNLSDFILYAVANKKFITVDTYPFYAVATEIARIGSNINQIARIANSTGHIYSSDIEQIQKSIYEIKLIIHKCMGIFIEAREGKINGIC